MTVPDTLSTASIPRPRAPQDDEPRDDAPLEDPTAPAEPTVGEFPWPEPWRHNRGARPRSEYWDAATAGWHSRGPIFPTRAD